MAVITRSARASVDASTTSTAPQITGNLYAGEDLPAVAVCRIAGDGTVMRATSAHNMAGITGKEYKSGEPVTIFRPGVRAKLSDGTLTPGALYYKSATAGQFDDTVAGTAIALAINAFDIMLIGVV